MVKRFKAEVSFKLNDKDKKLYDKYAIPAIELAEEGEYLAAIKLIDKILKENPKCEFALFLKANYLFNHITNNMKLEFDEIDQNNIGKIIKEAKNLEKDTKKCIKIIDKILKINPKNKEAKKFRKFIEKNLLKKVEDIVEKAQECKKRLKEYPTKINAKIICPYCKKEITVKVKKTQDEYDCSICNKRFLAIIGEVRGVRGLGGYISTVVTIRLKNIEGGESAINYYSSYRGIELRSGDWIGVVYKKGLFGSYKSKPAYIINWTIGICYEKL